MLPALLLVAPISQRGPIWWAVADFAHAPIFCLVTAGCFMLVGAFGIQGRWRRFWVAVLLALSIAVASELMQIMTRRDASMLDLLTNVSGIAAATLLVLSGIGSIGKAYQFSPGLLRFGALTILATRAIPVGIATISVVCQIEMFPDLLPTNCPGSSSFVLPAGGSTITTTDAEGLLVELGDGPWPGIAFAHLESSWVDYSHLTLEFELEKDELPLIITIRIHDERHNNRREDRFSKTVTLYSGRSLLKFDLTDIQNGPEHRLIDLRDIEQIIIYSDIRSAGRHFYLRDMFLQ